MRRGRTGARVVRGVAAVALALALPGHPAAQTPSTLDLLDQYAVGKFADVNATLAKTENFKRIYKDLRQDDVKAWLDQGGPADRARRELAAAVNRLATDTGGIVLTTGAGVSTGVGGNLGPVFLQVLERFRSAYVLYYSPSGVERSGFHTISVSVRRPGAVVEARRGYFGG